MKSRVSLVVPDSMFQPYQRVRSIGEVVRESYRQGVMPSFPLKEVAVDDDGSDVIDPRADPTTDRMDILDMKMSQVLSQAMDSYKSDKKSPEPEPVPEPAPEPTPTE